VSTPLHVFGAFGPGGALVAGLAIGMLFGWFLERGGLGNARKLAGQFYLRDLTVFKVMFTALLTALLGVFWLTRVGVLEPRLLDVPVTYSIPMAVGGVVFGVGFVVGGLCPGTSCVAASSGRIDGMLVVAGMLGGVLAFMELHPWVETFHNSTGRGVDTLPSLVGVSPGGVVLVITVAALVGFAVAERIDGPSPAGWVRRPLAVTALVLAVGAASPFGSGVQWPGRAGSSGGVVEPVELARWIRAGRRDLRVIDVRPAEAFEDFHLPLAENVPFARLARVNLERSGHVVVYGFGEEDGGRARVLLERRGMEEVEVVRGGLRGWLLDVMLARLPAEATPEERAQFAEIRALSRYFGGTPGGPSDAASLDIEAILGRARRASCGW